MPAYQDWGGVGGGGLLNVQIQGPILRNSDSAGPENAFEQHLSLRGLTTGVGWTRPRKHHNLEENILLSGGTKSSCRGGPE